MLAQRRQVSGNAAPIGARYRPIILRDENSRCIVYT